LAEKTLFPADLESADEVFITSTTRDLMPVASVEGLRIGQGRLVRDRLQQAFSAYTAAYVASRVREVEKAS
jgi:branched-chain amino acid aminotransferase